MRKYLLVVGLLLVQVIFLTAQTVDEQTSYSGHRLFISDIEIYQKKADWIRIEYFATNTGREAINSSKKNPLTDLQVNFDKSLEEQKLGAFENQIKNALSLEKIKLAVGQRSDKEYVKFLTKEVKQTTEKEVEQEVDVIASTPEKIPISMPNTDKKGQATFVKKNKNSESIVEESEEASMKEKETEEVIVNLPKEKTKKNKRKKKEDKIAFTTNTEIDTTTVEALLEEKASCPDLLITNIRILKQSKRWLTLEYTIANQGKGTAELFGENGKETDNLAIRAYMSGSEKLSRGAINLGGEFHTTGDGNLAPGEELTGVIKLDISTKTRYTPVVLLSLDAFQTTKECDRTNNVNHVLVR